MSSGWTTETALAHLSAMIVENEKRTAQEFRSQEKAVAAALASSSEALRIAQAANDKRLDAMNEFREQLSDQAGTLLPRAEYVVQHAALIDRMDSGLADLDRQVGQLREEMRESIGRHAGTRTSVATIIAIAAGIIAATGVIVAVVEAVSR